MSTQPPQVVKVGNALDLDGYPVSPAWAVGDRVETAGVIAVDPRSGEVVPGDVAAQTAQAIDNLASVLEAAGCALDEVVWVDVVLADAQRDFAAFNDVYAERFRSPYPARRTVGAQLALPELLVEIRAVAVRRG